MKGRERLVEQREDSPERAVPDKPAEFAVEVDLPRLRARGRLPVLARSCAYVVASLLAVLVTMGVFLVVRLAQGPMAIDGLGPSIAQALDQRFGHGYDFAFGQTSMLQRGYSPTLGVDRLVVKDQSGRTLLSAPRAEVSVDLLSLAGGKIAPKRLEIFDVELRLALLPDGSIAQLAGGGSEEAVAITPPLAESLRREAIPAVAPSEPAVPAGAPAAEPPAQPKPRALLVKQLSSAMRLVIDALTSPNSQIAAVDRVGITRGRIVIDDRTSNQKMTFDGVNLAFDKTDAGTRFDLSVDGPNGRWSASGLASGQPGADRRLTFSLQNLSMDEILLATGVRTIGADFDMPLSAHVDIGLRADGVLSEAVATFGLGSGYLRFDDPNDEPLIVDEIKGGVHWDGGKRRIMVDPVTLVAGQSHGAVSGFLALPEREGDAWTVELGAPEPLVAAPERPGQQPVVLDLVSLTGRLFLADKKFIIDKFMLGGPQAGFSMTGDVDWTNGPRVRLGASIDPTPVSIVTRLWPSFMAAPIRNYLLDHVGAGVIRQGSMRLDFSAADLESMRNEHSPPDEALLVDFVVSGGSVEFLNGAPPLTGIDGVGHVTGRSTTFTTTSPSLVEAGAGRILTIAPGGSFHIPDSEQRPVPAAIVANVSGAVEAVSELLSREALKPYASLPLDPATLRGQVDGRLEVDLRLGPKMGPADTSLKINATASNFTADNILGKEPLDAATLNIVVDSTGLKASGQGKMFGAPATVELAQPAGKPAFANVHVLVDDAARARQGLGGVPGVTGVIAAAISAPLGAGPNVKAEVELDLSRAAIDWPGASKPLGRPGKAKFALVVTDGQSVLDQIAFDAGTLQARGQIELAADQSIQSAKFPQVKFSTGDDARLEALKVGETLKVTVRAQTIDARPFLKTLLASSADATPAPGVVAGAPAAGASTAAIKEIDLDVKSALLTGYNKQVLSGLELRMLKRGDQFKQLSFAGRFGRDTVSGNLAGPSNASQLTMLSDDAGSLLLFTDLYRHMERGQLQANMQLGPAMSGTLVINAFVLRDEPALRRLVAESAPAGDAADKLRNIDAGAMAFNRLQVRFDRAGTRLQLHDGVINGEAIGLTVDGWIDFARDAVDMKGTFVPAYAVNNLFSKIPVVGLILGGGANEGLIGVNYRVEGTVSTPTLSINPLSAIAPGIFRQIFGVGQHIPGAGQ
ncbi:hypothetical protein CR492_07380 [Methylocella silvestris]|uniref:YhdP central domain-containing protein n=1 Tax=Methylocella silvestris TaxID=199596 RepID=A0A2J7TIB1_METSI|nr:hypothetical protein CR492_07380 [Methylocella silvestris]